jgi:hypothetical protein
VAAKHYLPSKVNSYLRRLVLEYQRANSSLLREIVTSAHIAVKEETDFRNWNGNTYRYFEHDVVLFLPQDIMAKISLEGQKELCNKILQDLNICAEAIDNESFRTVVIQLFDEHDPLFQGATALTEQPLANPDTLSIWRPGYIRLFKPSRYQKGRSEAAG